MATKEYFSAIARAFFRVIAKDGITQINSQDCQKKELIKVRVRLDSTNDQSSFLEHFMKVMGAIIAIMGDNSCWKYLDFKKEEPLHILFDVSMDQRSLNFHLDE